MEPLDGATLRRLTMMFNDQFDRTSDALSLPSAIVQLKWQLPRLDVASRSLTNLKLHFSHNTVVKKVALIFVNTLQRQKDTNEDELYNKICTESQNLLQNTFEFSPDDIFVCKNFSKDKIIAELNMLQQQAD